MSVFARMSTGILFVSEGRRAEGQASGASGTTAGIRFGHLLRRASERLAEESTQVQRFSIGMRMRDGSRSPEGDAYWQAPWRRVYAPLAVRQRLLGPRVVWSKRVGM